MAVSGPVKVFQPVTDFYYIKSRLNPDLVLGIYGGYYDTRSYIVTDERKGSEAYHQQWYFENAGDGYVYIISRFNGLVFDIKNGNHNAGAYVQTFTRNNPPRPVACQKWKFEDKGLIKSQLNGQFLSIRYASTKPNSYVIMDRMKKDALESQQWTFEPVSTTEGFQVSSQKTVEVVHSSEDLQVNEACGQSADPKRSSSNSDMTYVHYEKRLTVEKFTHMGQSD